MSPWCLDNGAQERDKLIAISIEMDDKIIKERE